MEDDESERKPGVAKRVWSNLYESHPIHILYSERERERRGEAEVATICTASVFGGLAIPKSIA